MDESLRLIEYLYDEVSVEDAEAIERRLADDDTLRSEFEELRAAKTELDRRAAQRSSASPDPLVVDQVVAAAGEAARARGTDRNRPARGRRTDRDAREGTPSLARRLQLASAALAVVLLVGVGWWQWTGEQVPAAGTTANGPALEQMLDRATQGADPARRLDGTALQGTAQRTAQVPEWDEGDEVVRLHRRIELLQSRSTPTQWNAGLQSASQSIRP